jgi:hypothetical protein
MKAGGPDTAFTLLRMPRVHGTVVDSDTKKPIDVFVVVPGFKIGEHIAWERARAAPKPRGGKFDYGERFEREGYATRIESEGYVPAESRVFTADEQDIAFNFELKRGKDVTGVLRSPSGQPVAKATVALALAGQTIVVSDGQKLIPQSEQSTTTDASGNFRFPPQAGSFLIVAFSDAGYVQLDQSAIAASGEVTLQPWGRIEGVMKVANAPGVKQKVAIDTNGTHAAKSPHVSHEIRTTTDDQGRFTFERVPPGFVPVSREFDQWRGESWSGFLTLTQNVRVDAGKTVHIQLGATERTITGKVIFPKQAANKKNWLITHSIAFAMPRTTSATDSKAIRMYAVETQEDGTFQLVDVAPGTYELRIIAQGPGGAVAGGTATVSVSANAGQTVEMSPIELK